MGNSNDYTNSQLATLKQKIHQRGEIMEETAIAVKETLNMLQSLVSRIKSGEGFLIRNFPTTVRAQELISGKENQFGVMIQVYEDTNTSNHDNNYLGDVNDFTEDEIVGDKLKVNITDNKGGEGIQKMYQDTTTQDQELTSVKENLPDKPIQVHESKHPRNHDNNYRGELNNTAEDEIVGRKNTASITNNDCRLSKQKFSRLLQEEIRHKVETEEHKKKVKMKLQRQKHEVCLRKGEMYKAHKMFDEMTEMFLKHSFFKNCKDVEILVKNVRHKERFKKNKIAFGAATGLVYLREDCFPKTFHKRVDVFSFGISLISEHVSLILRGIDSSQKKLTKMENELLGYERIDLSRPNIASELKLFLQHHQLPLGKDSRTGITEMVASVGHLCEKFANLLTQYMTYRVSGPCPDDWSLAQKLILRGCELLPRKRCFAKSVPKVDLQSFPPTLTEQFFIDALWFVNDSSVKESLWKPVSDKIVTWSGLGCKNFDCLNSQKLSRECAGCFDLASANENQRYVKVRGKNDFLIDDVLTLGSGGIRIRFDYQGGVLFFSSSTWSTKIFSTTQVLHYEHALGEFQRHKLENFLRKEEMADARKLFDEMLKKNTFQNLVSLWKYWHKGSQDAKKCTERQRIQSVLEIILGGGIWTQLYPFPKKRAKLAVSLEANYRLIDIHVRNYLKGSIFKMPYSASMGMNVISKKKMLNLLGEKFHGANEFGSAGTPSATSIRMRVQAYLYDGYWEDVGDDYECVMTLEGHENEVKRKLFTWVDGDIDCLRHDDKDAKLVPTCVATLVEPNFCQVACRHSLTAALNTSGHVHTMECPVSDQLRWTEPWAVETILQYASQGICCLIHSCLACGRYLLR